MSDFDLLVRHEQDIGIREGKIVALGANLSGSAASEIDATGLAIFPGVIDAHVHFNDPGRTEWEGFATGSRAAAAGGTTTVFDMPLNAHPPTIDGPSFDAKLAAALQHSLVDFALWGGLVPGNIGELETLRDRGVIFQPIERAILEHEELFRRHFMSEPATLGSAKYAALHQALLSAGAFLYVQPGLATALQIEIFHWLANDDAAVVPPLRP